MPEEEISIQKENKAGETHEVASSSEKNEVFNMLKNDFGGFIDNHLSDESDLKDAGEKILNEISKLNSDKNLGVSKLDEARYTLENELKLNDLVNTTALTDILRRANSNNPKEHFDNVVDLVSELKDTQREIPLNNARNINKQKEADAREYIKKLIKKEKPVSEELVSDYLTGLAVDTNTIKENFNNRLDKKITSYDINIPISSEEIEDKLQFLADLYDRQPIESFPIRERFFIQGGLLLLGNNERIRNSKIDGKGKAINPQLRDKWTQMLNNWYEGQDLSHLPDKRKKEIINRRKVGYPNIYKHYESNLKLGKEAKERIFDTKTPYEELIQASKAANVTSETKEIKSEEPQTVEKIQEPQKIKLADRIKNLFR